MRLQDKVIRFFQRQHLTIVSTMDKNGIPHNSCKGIVDIDGRRGWIYILDLYKARTFENLKRHPYISIVVVDEHKFIGYCLKGEAKIINRSKLSPHLIKMWNKRIATRITQRLLKEIRGERGHKSHTEAVLPKPQYLIAIKVREVVDLTPYHLRELTR